MQEIKIQLYKKKKKENLLNHYLFLLKKIKKEVKEKQCLEIQKLNLNFYMEIN